MVSRLHARLGPPFLDTVALLGWNSCAGSAGPQEVDFYDSIDGSYFLTRRGGMKLNARFLENNLIDLDTFKAACLHTM